MKVAPGLFVPRPETELLVDEAVARLKDLKQEKICILDLCAGTGAIALAIAHELPPVRAWMIDIDPLAVKTARENTDRLGLAGRVTALQGDTYLPAADLPSFHLM